MRTTKNQMNQNKIGKVITTGFLSSILMFANFNAVADCMWIGQNGSCPTLPTAIGTCGNNCPTYWVYTSFITYRAQEAAGPCLNPSTISVYVSCMKHVNSVPNQCASVGNCTYLSFSDPQYCDTISCQDWCGGS